MAEHVLIKLRNLCHLFTNGGKAGDRDHLWPELNTYQLIIFTKDMHIGVMWSICTAFAADITGKPGPLIPFGWIILTTSKSGHLSPNIQNNNGLTPGLVVIFSQQEVVRSLAFPSILLN